MPSLPALRPWLQTSGDSVKGHVRGTHRRVEPAVTLAEVNRHRHVTGITRVANVTGLDHIGVPVVAVYRPNSRSVAVSQGKGLDLVSATVSGLMEGIESYHAEYAMLPLKLACWTDLVRDHPVVHVDRLPRLASSSYHPDRPLLWAEGHDIQTNETCWVPFELVHTNFSLPLPSGSGSFVMSSNGLASGNHLLEATSHAICEVVERDAMALWSLAGGIQRTDCRVRLDSIDDVDLRGVLARLEAAGIEVGIWDITSDVGLAAFACVIVDRQPNVFRHLYSAYGSGCHPVREIAALRAVTEAVQCRLTYIAGARDDGDRAFFDRARNPDRVRRTREQLVAGAGQGRAFQAAPTYASPTFAADVAWELDQLATVGANQVVVVDLTQDAIGVPVVRVIVPGLESLHDAPGYVPGERARALAGAGAP